MNRILYEIGIISELQRNTDTENNRGMLTTGKLDPHRKEYDFSVDNPIGRERFEKAIRDELKLAQSRPKNDPVFGFYHYKRWLWLQFPWICLDRHIEYGKLVDVSFGFNGYTYLSYKTEAELMEKLDGIVTEAKKRKTKAGQPAPQQANSKVFSTAIRFPE